MFHDPTDSKAHRKLGEIMSKWREKYIKDKVELYYIEPGEYYKEFPYCRVDTEKSEEEGGFKLKSNRDCKNCPDLMRCVKELGLPKKWRLKLEDERSKGGGNLEKFEDKVDVVDTLNI